MSRTRCIGCPVGYESDAGSADIGGCKHNDLAAIDPSKYFSAGEVWTGSYYCNLGNADDDGAGDDGAAYSYDDDSYDVDDAPPALRQGHGHLEIYVVGDNADGSITLVRSFTNSFTSGSYYMTVPGRPSLHDVVEASAGDWITKPANKTIQHDGHKYLVYTVQSGLVGNISKMSGDKVSFHGDMCGNGHFSVTRACAVGKKPAFVAGEHWIGNYQCIDNTNPDRIDVRRLDLVVTDATENKVQVIHKLEHQDATDKGIAIGQASYRQVGTFNTSTHRLHFMSDGKSAWIKRPSKNWYTSDLNGFVTDDLLVYSGSKNGDPNCGCTGECTLDRVFAAPLVMWRCPTHEGCPNADKQGDEWTVGCERAQQSCSTFEVHRVCSPYNTTEEDACACTGQVDTRGRGGECGSYDDDERGNWCHVDPECIAAGPDDDTNPVTDGGVARSGLWWGACDPSDPKDCGVSDWAWDEVCTPDAGCDDQNPTGTQRGSRKVLADADEGGSCDKDLKTTKACTPEDGCKIVLDTTTTATVSSTTVSTTTTKTTTSATTVTATTKTTTSATTVTVTSKTATTVTATSEPTTLSATSKTTTTATTITATSKPTTSATTVTVTSKTATTVTATSEPTTLTATSKTTTTATTATVTTVTPTPTTTMPSEVTEEVTSDEIVVGMETTIKSQQAHLSVASLPLDYDECCAAEDDRKKLEGEIADTINGNLKELSSNVTVELAPGSVTVEVSSATEEDGKLVATAFEGCELCFAINGETVCANLPGETACPVYINGEIVKEEDPGEVKLVCSEAQIASLGGCFNGGECVLTRAPTACDDETALYDVPKCMCSLNVPAEGAPLCYYDDSCASPVQCPVETKACNYRKQVPSNKDPSDPKFNICNTQSDDPERTRMFCTQPQASAALTDPSTGNESASTTELVLIVLGIIVLLVLLLLLCVYCRGKKSGDGTVVASYQNPLYVAPTGAMPVQTLYDTAAGAEAESNTDGFSNPMYDAVNDGQQQQVPESAYADLSPAVAEGAYASVGPGVGGGDPAYFDISPNGAGGGSKAYMDVSPNAGGGVGGGDPAYFDISPNGAGAGGGSKAYMDVSPNAGGGGGGEAWHTLHHNHEDGDGAYDNVGEPGTTAGYLDIGAPEPTYDVGMPAYVADQEGLYDDAYDAVDTTWQGV